MHSKLDIGLLVQEFDGFLQHVLTDPGHSAAERQELLQNWDRAPSARDCHPREEHLLPLFVIAGAAGGSTGKVIFDDELMGVKVSSFQFDG